MNRIVKTVTAAALALVFVAEAAPLTNGRPDFSGQFVVAEAAQTKLIENGARYFLGDTIDFGSDDVWATWHAYKNERDTTVNAKDRSYKIDYISYYDERSGWEPYYAIAQGTSSSYGNIRIESDKFTYDVVGVEVKGSGTKTDPYTFSLIEGGPTITMRGINVALKEDISLKFHTTQNSIDSTGVDSVTMTGPNGTLTVNTPFEEEDDLGQQYVFSYPLYANQLDEDVTIQFNKGSETVKIKGDHPADIYNGTDTFSYNVNTYCDTLINSKLHHRTKDAVRALKNLGIAADNYFDGASMPLTIIRSDFSDIDDAATTFSSEEAKLSLVLDSKLSSRIYINGLTAGEQSDDGEYTAITGKDGKACFEIHHINPAKLEEFHSITYKGKTYSFSAVSYCSRALNSADPKTVALAKAAYEYAKYIRIYASRYDEISVYAYYLSPVNGKLCNDQLIDKYIYTDETTWEMLVESEDTLKIEDGKVWAKLPDFDWNIDYKWDVINGVSPEDLVGGTERYYVETVLDFYTNKH